MVRLGILLDHPAAMGQRLIISDNQDEPGNPLILDGEAIDAAAKDPLVIGQLMVDQVWAGGHGSHGRGALFRAQ